MQHFSYSFKKKKNTEINIIATGLFKTHSRILSMSIFYGDQIFA